MSRLVSWLVSRLVSWLVLGIGISAGVLAGVQAVVTVGVLAGVPDGAARTLASIKQPIPISRREIDGGLRSVRRAIDGGHFSVCENTWRRRRVCRAPARKATED